MLQRSEGFGLIELLISMLMLNIGILAIVAAFNSGALALKRAGEISTASVLADKQMELYRALKYTEIALVSTAVDDRERRHGVPVRLGQHDRSRRSCGGATSRPRSRRPVRR